MDSATNKQRIGLVAYDNVSNQENRYLKAFRSYYQDSDYYFQNAWSSIEEIIEHIRNQGSATLNELSRIIIFDSAFADQNMTNDIVNKFVSLEELMDNRNVNKPILSFATTNQQVFDLFKQETSPEGHELFPYRKTRIYRIKSDQNGSFNMGDLNKLLKGQLDEGALAIRNEYEGREAISRRTIEDFKSKKLNKTAAQIDELLSDNKTEDEKNVRLSRNETKDLIEELKQKNEQQEERINKESIEKENSRLHQSKEIIDIQEQNNDTIKDELKDSIKGLRKKSLRLNYDTKIHNDKGTILIGGSKGSGTSGIVANLAMFYAICGKKVLIVNMSDNDHITRYFKDFKQYYDDLGRNKVMMTKFAKKLSEISVPVSKNIDMISDFGITQKSYSEDELFSNYDRIIRSTTKYDVTLISAGENIEKVFMKTNKSYFNDLIFVSCLEDLNDIDIDLIDNLKKFNMKIKHLDHQPGIIINQIKYYQNSKDLNDKILKMNQPFDKFRLVGYFDYDKEWFTQIESGCPLIPRSRKIQNYCHDIAKNIILNDVE